MVSCYAGFYLDGVDSCTCMSCSAKNSDKKDKVNADPGAGGEEWGGGTPRCATATLSLGTLRFSWDLYPILDLIKLHFAILF